MRFLSVIVGLLTLFTLEVVSNGASARAETMLSNEHLAVEFSGRAWGRLADPSTNQTLLAWERDAPGWYFTVQGDYTPVSPGLPREIAAKDDNTLVLRYLREETPEISGTLTLRLANAGFLDFQLDVENRSIQTIALVGCPGGLIEPGGEDRYLVYPYQSGALVPLDARFDRMRIYGTLPFVLGYPSNVMSMQWMGVQRPEASVMIMSADRYGWLKRMGAERAGAGIRLVCETDVELPPDQTVRLPVYRIVPIAKGGYMDMAAVYRQWVAERSSDTGTVQREKVNGIEMVPLQYISLDAKRKARPGIDRLIRTHGYPEHAVRGKGEGRVAFMPYGAVAAMVQAFQDVYDSKVVPQLWSFTRSADEGGWPLLPIDPLAEAPRTLHDVTFADMSFAQFSRTVRANDDVVVLYTNPTFIGKPSPDYDPDLLFDTTGHGQIRMGGLAAQASEDSAYVSPSLVEGYQAAQLEDVLEQSGPEQEGTGAIMFDSSQAVGGTLFNNSILRRDPLTDIDRNPAARYVERYGYYGRNSYVQDRLKRDLALHEAAPQQSKGGEWACELTTMYLDINAGSICLRREYPDDLERKDNVIPVPLYQMVYGDAQYFTIRVGAASDANLGNDDPRNVMPAETARRSTALFGGVHQVLMWGGVPWAGPAYHKRYGMAYLVTRDNLARTPLFGKRAAYCMWDAAGQPAVAFYAVRQTWWFDSEDRPTAWHLDNNSGVTANIDIENGPAVQNLWGTDAFVPDSLDRLKRGSTATLMRNGSFVLWHFAGSATWPTDEGPCTVTVTDASDTPEDLAIVWDGERLSFGNASTVSREVCLEVAGLPFPQPAPVPDKVFADEDGTMAPMSYMEATAFAIKRVEHGLRIELKLPPAPPTSSRAAPASLASFSAGV